MRLLNPYFKKYRKELIVSPLFKVIEAIFELLIPLIIAQIIDEGILKQNDDLIINKISLIFILYVIGFITSVISQYMSSKVANKIGYDLKEDFYHHILSLNEHQRFKYNEEELSNLLTNDINQITTGINMGIRLGLRAPVLMFGSLFFAFRLNQKITILFFIATILIITILCIITNKTAKMTKKIQKLKDNLFKTITNKLDGIKTIRGFNKTKEEELNIRSENEVMEKAYLQLEKIDTLTSPISFLIIQTTGVFLVIIASSLIYNGVILQGTVVAFINYLNQLLLAMIVLINVIGILVRSNVSAKRIEAVMKEKNTEEIKSRKIDSIEELEFDKVSFKYQDISIINNLSFKVKKGETLAIIGSTGMGKTTIAKLCAGLFIPTSGKVKVNGIILNKIKEEILKNKIGYAFQESKLMNDTIEKNICLDEKYSEEQFKIALRKSQSYNFVENTKEKEKTIILENGKNLSGGEKQRILLARLLIKNPELIILDDASSALDLKTEKEFFSSLKNDKNSIKIIISSRIQVIKDANYILLLGNDNVISIGDHNTLYKENEEYRNMCKIQRVKGDHNEKE